MAVQQHVCADGLRWGRRRRHDRRGADAERRGAPADHRARRGRPAGGQHGGRRHRVQRHAPRGAPHRSARRSSASTAILSVTPYYNRPTPRGHPGPLRGGRQGDRPADRPLQHPVADGHRHAQRPARRARAARRRRARVKQANNDNLALVDGLELYAGNDEMRAPARWTWAAPAASASPATCSGRCCARIVDEPERRARGPRRAVAATLPALNVAPTPSPIKAALELAGLAPAACGCRSSRPTRASATRSAPSSSGTGCWKRRAVDGAARCASSPSAAWGRSART